ncbi:MAG: hypothetical protein HQK49_22540, partial [Oligoflexia bacterium]|nr:hypothetical protein [Oligoflexia bacterium]
MKIPNQSRSSSCWIFFFVFYFFIACFSVSDLHAGIDIFNLFDSTSKALDKLQMKVEKGRINNFKILYKSLIEEINFKDTAIKFKKHHHLKFRKLLQTAIDKKIIQTLDDFMNVIDFDKSKLELEKGGKELKEFMENNIAKFVTPQLSLESLQKVLEGRGNGLWWINPRLKALVAAVKNNVIKNTQQLNQLLTTTYNYKEYFSELAQPTQQTFLELLQTAIDKNFIQTLDDFMDAIEFDKSKLEWEEGGREWYNFIEDNIEKFITPQLSLESLQKALKTGGYGIRWFNPRLKVLVAAVKNNVIKNTQQLNQLLTVPYNYKKNFHELAQSTQQTFQELIQTAIDKNFIQTLDDFTNVTDIDISKLSNKLLNNWSNFIATDALPTFYALNKDQISPRSIALIRNKLKGFPVIKASKELALNIGIIKTSKDFVDLFSNFLVPTTQVPQYVKYVDNVLLENLPQHFWKDPKKPHPEIQEIVDLQHFLLTSDTKRKFMKSFFDDVRARGTTSNGIPYSLSDLILILKNTGPYDFNQQESKELLDQIHTALSDAFTRINTRSEIISLFDFLKSGFMPANKNLQKFLLTVQKKLEIIRKNENSVAVDKFAKDLEERPQILSSKEIRDAPYQMYALLDPSSKKGIELLKKERPNRTKKIPSTVGCPICCDEKSEKELIHCSECGTIKCFNCLAREASMSENYPLSCANSNCKKELFVSPELFDETECPSKGTSTLGFNQDFVKLIHFKTLLSYHNKFFPAPHEGFDCQTVDCPGRITKKEIDINHKHYNCKVCGYER